MDVQKNLTYDLLGLTEEQMRTLYRRLDGVAIEGAYAMFLAIRSAIDEG